MVLNVQQQLRRRFIELALEEIGPTYHGKRVTHTLARAQTQRGLDVLDREIVLTDQEPDLTAEIPTAGEARVQSERTVDQPDRGPDVLAEIRQREGCIGEGARVVLRHL